MSLAGHIMTMRARVERPNATTGAWGTGPADPSSFTLVNASQECFIWIHTRRGEREVVDDDKTAVVEIIDGIFPAGADLQRQDRITALLDRNGGTILTEELEIDAITERSQGPGQEHIVAQLRRHRG